MRLFENGVELTEYNRECDVLGIFKFRTGEMIIKLNCFYKELTVKIIADNEEIIFNSKSQLFRTEIVFDNSMTEYSFRKIPNERFYILTNINDEFFVDANYNSYKKTDYVIHSLDVENDCIITVNNHIIFKNISEESEVQLYVDNSLVVKKTAVYFSGKEHCIYKDIPELRIICDSEKSSNYIIDVNDNHVDIGSILKEKEDVSICLSELTKENFVSIVLRKKGSLNHLREWNIAVLKNFEYSIDKELYYNEKTVYLEDIYADNVNFDITEYPCAYQISRTRKINIDASAYGKEFYISITVPVIYWEINDEYNSFSGKKYVHISELKNIRSVYVDIPVENAQIMAVNENMNRIVSVTNKKADISDFKISNSDSTSFGLIGRKVKQLAFFEIIYTSAVRELKVSCNDSELMISFVKIGSCQITLKIIDKESNAVFSKEYSSLLEENVSISEDIAHLQNGRYTTVISMIKADEFGFCTSETIIGSYEFIKGNPLDIYFSEKNNLLKPDYCYYDSEQNRVCNFYCENILKADSESEIYTADAYFYNRHYQKVFFSDANPMRIEFLEGTEKYLTFTITDKEGDGLLYEKARGYLINDQNGSKDYYSYKLPDHYAIRI